MSLPIAGGLKLDVLQGSHPIQTILQCCDSKVVFLSSCNTVIWSMLCLSVAVMLMLNESGEFCLEGSLNKASGASVSLH